MNQAGSKLINKPMFGTKIIGNYLILMLESMNHYTCNSEIPIKTPIIKLE